MKAVALEPGNAQLKELLDQAVAAAKPKARRTGSRTWSDEEEEAPAPAPAPAAAAGGKRPADGGGGSGGRGDAPPPKQRSERARSWCQAATLAGRRERRLLRACLLQLGKGDEAVAEKALHMLEGLNASSNDEDDDDDGGGGGKGSDSD